MKPCRLLSSLTTALLVISLVAMYSTDASAQQRRGGGKPSMGRTGGSGARPSGGRGNFSARPQTSRPTGSRSSSSRPSFGNAGAHSSPNRSNLGTRGSTGGARPSLGGVGSSKTPNRPTRPNVGNQGLNLGNRNAGNRPQNLPGNNRPTLPNNRPSTGLGQTKPSTRPSFGGNNRPGADDNRFNFGDNKPSFGNLNRPTTLPGNVDRPGSNNRPAIGGNNRPTTLPGTADRPSIGGGNRPGIGDGNRPSIGGGNRPGIGDNNRPVIGGNNRPGNNIVNRPVIGGNRPNFGGNTNVNINNKNNFNVGNKVGVNTGNRYSNRPRWDVDPGYSRPAWGIGGNNNWHDRWYNNGINRHYHGWYNGCWSGNYWNSNWYAPVAWGAVGWGLGSLTRSWGYGTAYYNPYYAQPVIAQEVPYDYSQPIVINNYSSADADSQGGNAQGAPVQENPQEQQGLSSFDKGLERFKAGSYQESLTLFDAALKQLPGDPVVHEMRCLALFAIGDYAQAAAGLNSLLASAPGMDWTTMSGLYGNPDDYKQQLRSLEQYCQQHPDDASAHFVLAYHDLVTGSKEGAIDALRVVVKNQPKDVTAKRMLDALAPPESEAQVAKPAPTEVAPAENAPETDLVGNWLAKTGNTQIELAIGEDSQFTWTATSNGKESAVLSGNLTASNDGIELDSVDQGSMAGAVQSEGPDAWQFKIAGAPASDPGLAFVRVK